MARPVYSARIFRAPSVSGGPTLVYTAGAGFVTVVKCISMVWGDVVFSGLDAWVQTADLTKLVRKTIATGLSIPGDAVGGCEVFFGDWTLTAGDDLYAQTAAGAVDLYCSGYVLGL